MLSPLLSRLAAPAIALVSSAVFLDSLRFKFTDHPNTREIFGRLDGWAATLGAEGLFGPTGLFSQYVIGSAEFVAAVLLLIGIIPGLKRLQALGALLAVAVMSGAVSFHLFTPLGIDPNSDGGGLFAMAVTVLVSNAVLLIMRRGELAALAGGVGRALVPAPEKLPRRPLARKAALQEASAAA